MTSTDQVRQRIAAIQALPRTHKCVTIYADGSTREVAAISENAAESHAVMKRRALGRDLIDRETGKPCRLVAVRVERI